MFDNVGTKIKKVSIVLFYIVSLACLVLAFVLGFDSYYLFGHHGVDFNAGIFFGFLVGGPVISYVSTLFLVGFGELVENSTRISTSPTSSEET